MPRLSRTTALGDWRSQAEPIVIIYGFLYHYVRDEPSIGPTLFLPWCARVCVWTAVLCIALAVAGACSLIDRFTRFSGELFGMLIAILFFQTAVKASTTYDVLANLQFLSLEAWMCIVTAAAVLRAGTFC